MTSLNKVENSQLKKESNKIYYFDRYSEEINYIILNYSIDEDGIHKDREKIFEIYNENNELLARYNKQSFGNDYEYNFGLKFNKDESIESMFGKMQKKGYSKYWFEGQKEGWDKGVLSFVKAKESKYSFKDIADILNISCQEVCNQFNQMAKESGYKLFN